VAGVGGRGPPYVEAVALASLTTAKTDVASFVRGKLFIAGVDADTPLGVALDALLVAVMDVPVEQLKTWRHELDTALRVVRPAEQAPQPQYPDRETWGLLPEHIAEMQWMLGDSGGPPG
jgi:hypothetical protein